MAGPSDEIYNEFKKLCIERLIYAVIYSISMQCILFVIFILFINFSLIHPITWITTSFSTVFSIYTWIWITPLITAVIIYWIFLSKINLENPEWYSSRFHKVSKNFLKLIWFYFIHIIIGLLTTFFYTKYLNDDYKYIAQKCRDESDKQCLNEKFVILILGGIYAAMYYFLRDQQKTDKKLNFPVIQIPKFQQIRSNFIFVFFDSMQKTFMPTIIFLSAYICLRFYLRPKISDLLSLNKSNDSITSIILDIRLLMFSWVLAAQIISNMSLIKILFNISMTQYYAFPIERDLLSNPRTISLVDALSCSKIHLSTQLAALDLFTLAHSNTDTRRKDIFSLSIPGGHPYNWQKLSKQCLETICMFKEEISKSLIKNVATAANNNNGIFEKPKSATEMAEKILRRQYNDTIGIRNMLYYSTTQESVQQNSQTSGFDIKINAFKSSLTTKINQFKKYIKNLPGIYYLFTEVESTKVSHLLSKSEHIVWIVQGLATLAVKSIREDVYGVVQDTLPEIIKTIVNLKITIDEITPLDLGGKKMDRNYCVLRNSIKRSLYKITSTFADYINDLAIDHEHSRILFNYIRHREP